jgi:hypothetical protein
VGWGQQIFFSFLPGIGWQANKKAGRGNRYYRALSVFLAG